MQTQEKLNPLRNEVEAQNAKLSDDEMKQVSGGVIDLQGDFIGNYAEPDRRLIPENTETVLRSKH